MLYPCDGGLLELASDGSLGEEYVNLVNKNHLIFQIRNYCGKYGECEVSLDTTGYNVLTMDTLQTKCGDTKVGEDIKQQYRYRTYFTP